MAALSIPALFVYGPEPQLVMVAGVSLGCGLHFAFLWAVLHLLSRFLGRMGK